MSAQPLPAAVGKAVEELQCRVWELCSLTECVAEATSESCGGTISDQLSAMRGLVRVAEGINDSMMPNAFLQRVLEIEAEAH